MKLESKKEAFRVLFMLLLFPCLKLSAQTPRGILEKGVAISYLYTQDTKSADNETISVIDSFLVDDGYSFFEELETDTKVVAIYTKETEIGQYNILLNESKKGLKLSTISFSFNSHIVQQELNKIFYDHFRQLALIGYGKVVDKETMAFFIEHFEHENPIYESNAKSSNDPIRSKYALFVPISISAKNISFGPAIVSDDTIHWDKYIYWLTEKLFDKE